MEMGYEDVKVGSMRRKSLSVKSTMASGDSIPSIATASDRRRVREFEE